MYVYVITIWLNSLYIYIYIYIHIWLCMTVKMMRRKSMCCFVKFQSNPLHAWINGLPDAGVWLMGTSNKVHHKVRGMLGVGRSEIWGLWCLWQICQECSDGKWKAGLPGATRRRFFLVFGAPWTTAQAQDWGLTSKHCLHNGSRWKANMVGLRRVEASRRLKGLQSIAGTSDGKASLAISFSPSFSRTLQTFSGQAANAFTQSQIPTSLPGTGICPVSECSLDRCNNVQQPSIYLQLGHCFLFIHVQ